MYYYLNYSVSLFRTSLLNSYCQVVRLHASLPILRLSFYLYFPLLKLKEVVRGVSLRFKGILVFTNIGVYRLRVKRIMNETFGY